MRRNMIKFTFDANPVAPIGDKVRILIIRKLPLKLRRPSAADAPLKLPEWIMGSVVRAPIIDDIYEKVYATRKPEPRREYATY